MMFSPVSSPERMDYSEESSFEELPYHRFTRGVERRQGERRRVSCPPRPQNTANHGRDVLGGEECTHFGTATRGVEETLGFLQLDSPPHGIVSSRGSSPFTSTHNPHHHHFLTDSNHRPTTHKPPFLSTYSLPDGRPHTPNATPQIGGAPPPIAMLNTTPHGSMHSLNTSMPPQPQNTALSTYATGSSSVRDADSASTRSTVSSAASGSTVSSTFSSLLFKGTDDDLSHNGDSGSDSDVSTLTGRSSTVIRAPSIRLRSVPSNAAKQNGDGSVAKGNKVDGSVAKEKQNGGVGSQSKCRSCLNCVWIMTCCLLLVGASLFAYSLYSENLMTQCLQTRTIPNLNSIQNDLNTKVFGQHIAVRTILDALRDFYHPSNMASTLVFSFHGWTGVGKNIVSGLLADGLSDTTSGNNAHVIKLIIPLHFPHEYEGDVYAEQIQEWIHSNITGSCSGNTVVILDEMDKVSVPVARGLHDVLASLKNNNDPAIEDKPEVTSTGITKHNSAEGTNPDSINEEQQVVSKIEEKTGLEIQPKTGPKFGPPKTKTLFMLLSNSGASSINAFTLNHMMNGKSRDTITRDQLEATLLDDEINDANVWYSQLYKDKLIDRIVPFLPLAESHVEMCIKSYLSSRNKGHVTDAKIKDIADNFAYFPVSSRLFSKAGCKRVADMVAIYTE